MPAGVGTWTAFGLAAEVGDWHRFTGNSIGAYLGLVPCEYSSGATRVQGSTGSVMRLLAAAVGWVVLA